MNRAELLDLIVTTLQDLLNDDSEGAPITIDASTLLYGPDGLLDSLRLVNLVLDLELELNDRLGTSVSITDSRAMSQQRSPFRRVGSLADYIMDLLNEEQRAAA